MGADAPMTFEGALFVLDRTPSAPTNIPSTARSSAATLLGERSSPSFGIDRPRADKLGPAGVSYTGSPRSNVPAFVHGARGSTPPVPPDGEFILLGGGVKRGSSGQSRRSGGGRQQRGGRSNGSSNDRGGSGGGGGGGGGGAKRRRKDKGRRRGANYGVNDNQGLAPHLRRRPPVQREDDADMDAMLDYLENASLGASDEDTGMDDGELQAGVAEMRKEARKVPIRSLRDVDLAKWMRGGSVTVLEEMSLDLPDDDEIDQSDDNDVDEEAADDADDDSDEDDDDDQLTAREERAIEMELMGLSLDGGDASLEARDVAAMLDALSSDSDDPDAALLPAGMLGDRGSAKRAAIMAGLLLDVRGAGAHPVHTPKGRGGKKRRGGGSGGGRGSGRAARRGARPMEGIEFVSSAGMGELTSSATDDDEAAEASAAAAGDEEDESEEEDNDPFPTSKSGLRKLARAQRRKRRLSDRDERKRLKAEQDLLQSVLRSLPPRASPSSPAPQVPSELLPHLDRLNAQLRDFASDSDLGATSLLPPMPSALRRLARAMCARYGIGTKCRGAGERKLTVLVRRGGTRVPESGWEGVVESCLGDVGWTLRGNVGRGTGAAGGGTKRGRGTKAGGKERKERKRAADQGVVRKAPGAPDDRAAPRAGDVVGQGAPVIGEGNRGFAMMQAMGWKVGEGTGAAAGAGRVEPVEAVVRAKRRGLGAE